MPQKIFDIIRRHGLKAIFHTLDAGIFVNEHNGEIFTSHKIYHALAKRLERREMIREAIQMYRQAANIFPPKGYESLKIAAELAQKLSLNDEAAKLWFESIYYSRNVTSKVKSSIKFLRELFRSKLE